MSDTIDIFQWMIDMSKADGVEIMISRSIFGPSFYNIDDEQIANLARLWISGFRGIDFTQADYCVDDGNSTDLLADLLYSTNICDFLLSLLEENARSITNVLYPNSTRTNRDLFLQKYFEILLTTNLDAAKILFHYLHLAQSPINIHANCNNFLKSSLDNFESFEYFKSFEWLLEISQDPSYGKFTINCQNIVDIMHTMYTNLKSKTPNDFQPFEDVWNKLTYYCELDIDVNSLIKTMIDYSTHISFWNWVINKFDPHLYAVCNESILEKLILKCIEHLRMYTCYCGVTDVSAELQWLTFVKYLFKIAHERGIAVNIHVNSIIAPNSSRRIIRPISSKTLHNSPLTYIISAECLDIFNWFIELGENGYGRIDIHADDEYYFHLALNAKRIAIAARLIELGENGYGKINIHCRKRDIHRILYNSLATSLDIAIPKLKFLINLAENGYGKINTHRSSDALFCILAVKSPEHAQYMIEMGYAPIYINEERFFSNIASHIYQDFGDRNLIIYALENKYGMSAINVGTVCHDIKDKIKSTMEFINNNCQGV